MYAPLGVQIRAGLEQFWIKNNNIVKRLRSVNELSSWIGRYVNLILLLLMSIARITKANVYGAGVGFEANFNEISIYLIIKTEVSGIPSSTWIIQNSQNIITSMAPGRFIATTNLYPKVKVVSSPKRSWFVGIQKWYRLLIKVVVVVFSCHP